jgi:two-component system OmpR family response regulator
MRLLVVEDDPKIAAFVVKGLEQAGFAVDQAADGEDGLHLALSEVYDAAIIDLMLPKLDGLSLIEALRRQRINTPVIILSARRTVADRVKGLQSGSDDYLVKPFSFAELLARVQALIRRTSGMAHPTRLKTGDLSLVSKTMILEHVWDYNFDPQTNVVDVLICRLRHKVDRDFEPRMIHTLRGVGYVLKVA